MSEANSNDTTETTATTTTPRTCSCRYGYASTPDDQMTRCTEPALPDDNCCAKHKIAGVTELSRGVSQ
jgi:hypothetical protein